MTLPDMIRTVKWMAADTARQAVATKLFWVMLAAAGTATLVCLSVTVAGDPPPVSAEWDFPGLLPQSEADKAGPTRVADSGARVIGGDMTLGFGLIHVPVGRNREDSVRQVELFLVGAAADTAGMLLAILWTAGFLPQFLDPQAASVLLAKPAPRRLLLLGKYAGVVVFVGLATTLYVGGTWLALGVRTGVWFPAYWLAVPLLTFNFAVFYAVSAFLAVWTRSAVASAFGTLLFWLLCSATNFARHHLHAFPPAGLSDAAVLVTDIGYWVLPKPLDLSAVFFDAMHAADHRLQIVEIQKAQEAGRLHPELAAATAAAFAAATLGLACYEFETTDY